MVHRGPLPRTTAGSSAPAAPAAWSPLSLEVDTIAAMLNAELVDHPVYSGIELQWFDDPRHGTGMLAFLQRRADRRVDYYLQAGLDLDAAGYTIGGGTGMWQHTTFDRALLQVGPAGVVADVRFRDVDGREIEVTVDDRDAGRRRTADLLAPVGADIDHPTALLLVLLHGFDLVRMGKRAPVIRIDGQPAATGRLPGRWLHRRHLIKVAAPLTTARVCPDRPSRAVAAGSHDEATLTARTADAEATLRLRPALPSTAALTDNRIATGSWDVAIDGHEITGGHWHVVRTGDRARLRLDVTRPWRPRGLPLFMRVVTRVLPVFRRWPCTYRWDAEVKLDDDPVMVTSRWARTSGDRGEGYGRATGRRSR